MKKKVFMLLWLTGVIIISVAYIVVTLVYHGFFNKQIESQIRTQAAVLKYGYEQAQDKTDFLSAVKADLNMIRLSIIEPDGNVSFDNFADSDYLNHHYDRPEIIKAHQTGSGEATRYSKTLNEKTYYYALMLNDGNIIRAAMTSGSIWSLFAKTLPFLLIIIFFLFIMAAVTAKILVKKIVSPLENLSHSLCGDTDVKSQIKPKIAPLGKSNQYDELTPIVEKIKLQNDTIQNQLKIKREFSSNVSHELKTPLTTILGFSELLSNDMVKEKQDILRFGFLISKEARRLLALIDDIMIISRLEESPNDDRAIDLSQEVLLNDLIGEILIELYEKAKSRGVSIKIKADEVVKIVGNKPLLHQVFFNLLDNAIKYNKDNGSVIITLSKKEETITVSVTDTGIGIEESHFERLFERFYRVDKSRSKQTGGTGLGLSIVKHAVELHGGVISLFSELNKGTTVIIEFTK